MSQVMASLWGHSRKYNESIAFSKSENPLFAPNVMNGLHNPRGDNLPATNPTNPFTLLPRRLSLLVDGKGECEVAHHKLIVSPVIVYLKHLNSLPHL